METQTLEYSSLPSTRVQVPPWVPGLISTLAVVWGITLRWASLGTNSLWFDEGYTAWAVDHPAGEIVRIIRADTAPPLYYILLHGWTAVFGRSEAGLRSMSALMASIAVFVFIAIANRLLKSPWAKTAAIVLFSLSFMQIAYAHEARFYAMMTMLGAIDFYLVMLICERSSVLRLGALALAWTASLYTNNVMAVYLLCLGIGWLLLPGLRSVKARAADLVIVSIISALSFAPWLPALLAQTRRIQAGFWPSAPDGFLLARTVGVLAGVHEQSLPAGDWWFVQINLAIVAIAAISCIYQRSRRTIIALAIFGLLPILLIYFYSQIRQPIFMERAFLASGVAIPLMLALSLEVSRTKAARFLSGGMVVLLALLSVRSLPVRWRGEHAEQWREACAYADKQAAEVHPRLRLTIFVANEGEILYDYYRRGSDYSPRSDLAGAPASFFALDPPQTMQRVRDDTDLDSLRRMLDSARYDDLVVIASHSWWGDHDEKALAMLSKRFFKTDERQFDQIRVFRFAGITRGG